MCENVSELGKVNANCANNVNCCVFENVGV